MPTIVSYQKFISKDITRLLRLPEDANHQQLGTELATLADGLTYVCLPVGAALPVNQPVEISASIVNPVTLTLAQIAEIKAKSPHVRLINQRVTEQISAKYSQTDEIGFCRTGALDPNFAAYNAHAESCRAWGAAQKAALGL